MGAAVAINTYDPYGLPASGNVGRFQYTGQMRITAGGLHHYKARAYHPMLGRFLQPDPLGYAAGMNLYAYVGGDPVNSRDPSGLLSSSNTEGCRSTVNSSGCAIIEFINEANRNTTGGTPRAALTDAFGNPCKVGVVCLNGAIPNFISESNLANLPLGHSFANTLLTHDTSPISPNGILHSISRLARVGAMVAAADDVTVVGAADDLAIPILLGVAAVAAGAAVVLDKIHGNSLQSQKPTTVYEVFLSQTGATLKFGITSANPSRRRYTQAFFGLFGAGIRDLRTFPSRAPARAEERRLCLEFTAQNGHLPPLSSVC